MLAHVYLVSEKREEARWLLEHYNYKKSESWTHSGESALLFVFDAVAESGRGTKT